MTRFPRLSRIAVHLAVSGVLALPALGCAVSAAPEPPLAAVAAQPAAAVIEAPAPAPAVIVRARLVPWGPTPGLRAGAPEAPAIAGAAAVVLDEASGTILHAKDQHARFPGASLTKIMTALVALERGHLDDRVDVAVDSRRMRGSTVMGLQPGETLTLEDLLYGLMLPSGNDAALAIAEHIGGSTDEFVRLMNQRAAELGMADTLYTNPHGLDSGGPYTSAFDLAVLTRTAMAREDFRTIANTRYKVVTGAQATYQLGNLNPLYGMLPGVDGVKTGYTRRARQTLVGSVTREGHRVYVVVLQSPDRAGDGTSLLNWAFAAHAWLSDNTVAAADAVDAAAVPGT
ncbi:MAG: D-alanyl-D-alanine carboxypeptidase family protein [Dehalococcoidia bacterium]